MNLMSLIFAFMTTLLPPQGNDGARYLEKAIAKFDSVKDYIVDVKVHLELKAVQAPDMEAKVYYKEPDKVKVDSKGLFFMPKEVGLMNPKQFDPAKYVIDVIDTATIDGNPVVRISLTAKTDESRERNVILTIDMKNWLIVEISTAPYPGRQASAKISYGTFDGFQMPVEIDVNLDVGKMNGEQRGFTPEHRRVDELKGKVEVYYSNYKINSGLSDDIFKKRKEE
jgi:hypothetical protein